MQAFNEELTNAYLGGLMDGSGAINVKITKNDNYTMGYNIIPQLTVSRPEPTSIQILDDWAAKNGIQASVNEYDEGKFRFRIGRVQDLRRFLELLDPYIMAKEPIVVTLLEDILPALQKGEYRESKQAFVEVAEMIDELRDISAYKDTDRKYTAEFFKNEWADDL